jgi:hypothetical protein
MFFILIVILNCIQIIALVCMISGPGDLDKNSFEPKDHNLEFIFGSRIYVEKFEKNLDNRDFY